MSVKYLTFLLVFVSQALSGQLAEDFSDGDFTANPPWTGQSEKFIVENGVLRLNDTQGGSAFLATQNVLSSDTEWEFWVRLAFTPSNNNHPRIYVMSNSADLAGSLDGYYLQIGKDGTNNKRLYFFRQTGETSVELMAGADNIAATTNNRIRIRIQRDKEGNWAFFADPEGGNLFVPQGNVTDNTYGSTHWFGIFCRYTATNATRFYFDDFKISQIVADTIAPTVTMLKVVGSNKLEVRFSEPVEKGSAENLSNYHLSDFDGGLINVKLENPDKAILSFDRDFEPGALYQLAVKNVADIAGNIMDESTGSFVWHVAKRHDVVFNEIMADPTPEVGLPAHEYVEFFNASEFDIDMKGWTFQHGTTQRIIPEGVIKAGGYLVITRAAAYEELKVFGNVVAVPGLSATALLNAGTSLFLYDEKMNLISQVEYTSSWYGDAQKASGGWSLERINPFDHCTGAENWSASNHVRGGTPGMANSILTQNTEHTAARLLGVRVENPLMISISFNVAMDENSVTDPGNFSFIPAITIAEIRATRPDFRQMTIILKDSLPENIWYDLKLSPEIIDCAGNQTEVRNARFVNYRASRFDVVFNEIMADPDPEVGLPPYEWVELYNTTEFDIDLKGWTFQHGKNWRTFPEAMIPARGYLVFTHHSALESLQSHGNVVALPGLSSTALINGGTLLALYDNRNEMISWVHYSDRWYGDDDKAKGGWSLEKIDPYNFCGEENNWRAGNDPAGGTPGVINSVFDVNPDTTQPQISEIAISSPMLVSVSFSENMDEMAMLDPSGYYINNNIGKPLAVSANDLNFKTVNLILPSALQENTIYEITFSDKITDCDGNPLSQPSAIFSTYKARRFDVVFNELMSNPTPTIGLPPQKYIELYNTSDFPLHLKGWTLSHGNSARQLPSISLSARGYAVITTELGYEDLKDFDNVFAVPGLSSTFLTIAGQLLTLTNESGELISWVRYNESWYGDASKAGGGWSLEKIDPYNFCEGKQNWKASFDSQGGTPGKSNSVVAANPDKTAPELLRAGYEDRKTISLFFSETMDDETLSDPNNYHVNNGIGTPVSVTVVAPDFHKVILQLEEEIMENMMYEIAVHSKVTDCAGNPLIKHTCKLAIPQKAESFDIVINEILFNPPDRGVRYIELYNRSQKTIDLRDLIISSRDTMENILTGIREISSESHLFFPGEYRVLTPDPAVVQQQYMTNNPSGFIAISMPPMTNSRGLLVLSGKGRTTIDQFSYSEDMHYALLTNRKGVALERLNYHRPTQDRSNWHSASQGSGFGTPGYKNSQFTVNAEQKGDAISIYPEIFSPDNDGIDDVLNISYKFDHPGHTANINIYDSRGRLVRTLTRSQLLATEGVITWDGITDQNQKAGVGIYIIYMEVFDPSGQVKTFRKTGVVASKL
jgi:hypothetical protein